MPGRRFDILNMLCFCVELSANTKNDYTSVLALPAVPLFMQTTVVQSARNLKKIQYLETLHHEYSNA